MSTPAENDAAFEKALAETRSEYREALDRLSDDTHTADYDAGRITPEGRARLDKFGSTLDAGNVRLLCERIADYPEVLAAAAEVLAEDMASMLDRFPQRGRHTRARWAVQWLGFHAQRETNLTRVTSPGEGRA